MKTKWILVIAAAICISGTGELTAQEIYAAPQGQTYGSQEIYDTVSEVVVQPISQPIQQSSYEVPYVQNQVQNAQFGTPYYAEQSFSTQAIPPVQTYSQSSPAAVTRMVPSSGNSYSSTSASPGLAQQKAQQAASMGFRNHVGGGLGGAQYEGVGWSSRSAQAAISNCCYWGQRTPVQIGVSKGADGCWYACVLYN